MIDKGFQFVSCASDAGLAASAADAVIGRLRAGSATAPRGAWLLTDLWRRTPANEGLSSRADEGSNLHPPSSAR